VDEVDSFIEKVKESEQLRTSLAQLGDEATKLQNSEFYQKLLSNPTFISLKGELEQKMTTLTTKAKDVRIDFMEALTKAAYPEYDTPASPPPSSTTALLPPPPTTPIITEITTTDLLIPLPHPSTTPISSSLPFDGAPPVPPRPSLRGQTPPKSPLVSTPVAKPEKSKPTKEERAAQEAQQREEKRKQLQAKLDHLQRYNHQMDKERQERLEQQSKELQKRQEQNKGGGGEVNNSQGGSL